MLLCQKSGVIEYPVFSAIAAAQPGISANFATRDSIRPGNPFMSIGSSKALFQKSRVTE